MPMLCRPITICLIAMSSSLMILFANHLPIRINLTGSMPRGIYLLNTDHEINRGDFVMVCLSDHLAELALKRRYIFPGNCKNGAEPLLKQVVARTHDVVILSDNSVRVNNKSLNHSGTLRVDTHNRKLFSVPRGIYILHDNQLWLYGTESAHSWDSRYFGAVDSKQVISIIKPIFITKGRIS